MRQRFLELSGWRRGVVEILAAVFLLLTFWAVGGTLPEGWSLDLGAKNAPRPWYGRFLAVWAFFGGAATLFLALGCWRLSAGREHRLRAAWQRVPDRRWVLYGSLLAFGLPALLRVHLLLGMPLLDDENAYRFSAEILASGRLYLESPPMKLFFDNVFLINDGKLYTQYFLGWPALLVPGVWLGVAGFMNAFYSALTVPALFLVVRRIAGGGWARGAVVVYLASPMLMVGAGTLTSHPTCLMALSWMTWFYLRALAPRAPWWAHAGLAVTFSAAFFIRPTTTLGLGIPFLVAWLARIRRRRPLRPLVAFSLPAAFFAALFLLVNRLQNGSWLDIAYLRYYEYAEANGFRFTFWKERLEDLSPNYTFGDPWQALGIVGSGLFRLHFALLGWPLLILFVLMARGAAAKLFWRSALFFLLVHFYANAVGVDTFAPMHYYELALPVLVLAVAGMRRLAAWLERLRRAGVSSPSGTLAPLLAAASILVALAGYVPIRFGAIHQVARGIHEPHRALAEAGIERGVIFTPSPFIDRCKYFPSVAYLFSHPNNDPELDNDVLWVNHLSLRLDKKLMADHFPDRRGYVMSWLEPCRVSYFPLDQLPLGSVPPADLPPLPQG